MTDDLEVPTELFASIPDDADEATKLYLRAQVMIQAAFHSMGDRDVAPGETTVRYDELEQVLSAALAMLVAADSTLTTRRDVRLRLEEHGKYMRGFAEALKDSDDRNAIDILDTLRIRKSSVN
jgi:hypothetical protein